MDSRWIHAQYEEFWQFNFESDERENSMEGYEQILAEAYGLAGKD